MTEKEKEYAPLVKKESKKSSCIIIEKFDTYMYIQLDGMVYSIPNSKVKDEKGNMATVEYEKDGYNAKFL